MRAVGFSHYGGPEVLMVVDLPTPSPGDGEVRIRVRAAQAEQVVLPAILWVDAHGSRSAG
jgi:NADPH:quinone reductase-like Zn-dependent oxidoreductase